MKRNGTRVLPGFQLTAKSKNRKTGRIPVSTSPQWTCPTSCAFANGNGCYAAFGPLKIVWDACTRGSLKDPSKSYTDFLDKVSDLPNEQLWRHNQAGDLVPDPKHPNRIDKIAYRRLIIANLGKRGFTYTHFPVLKQKGTIDKDIRDNRECITTMNILGMTVNVSANSPAHADQILDSGLKAPITVTVPEGYADNKSFKTPKGRKVIMCPALRSKKMTCVKCKKCADPNRDEIIAFTAHGCGRKHCQDVFEKWYKGVPSCDRNLS